MQRFRPELKILFFSVLTRVMLFKICKRPKEEDREDETITNGRQQKGIQESHENKKRATCLCDAMLFKSDTKSSENKQNAE